MSSARPMIISGPTGPTTIMTLDELPLRRTAVVEAIDWQALGVEAARRLRCLGLAEGVTVETLHAGAFGGDPIAVAIGRVNVALRRTHAGAVAVQPSDVERVAG
jgi:ferrous iron transport protein A